MSRITKTNIRNAAAHLQDLLIATGADKQTIEPIEVTVSMGSATNGVAYTLSFHKGHHVRIGSTMRESYDAIQAMNYALRFVAGK